MLLNFSYSTQPNYEGGVDYPFLHLSEGSILPRAGHSEPREYLLSDSKSIRYLGGFLSLVGYRLSVAWPLGGVEAGVSASWSLESWTGVMSSGEAGSCGSPGPVPAPGKVTR